LLGGQRNFVSQVFLKLLIPPNMEYLVKANDESSGSVVDEHALSIGDAECLIAHDTICVLLPHVHVQWFIFFVDKTLVKASIQVPLLLHP